MMNTNVSEHSTCNMSPVTPSPEDKLLALFKKIQIYNQTAMLGGSLAMYLQGFKLRRPVSDLDIDLPPGTSFIPLLNMTSSEIDEAYSSDFDFKMQVIQFEGVKINVFTPCNDFKVHTTYAGGFTCVRYDDIMRAKILYALQDNELAAKHQLDLIHYITGKYKPF